MEDVIYRSSALELTFWTPHPPLKVVHPITWSCCHCQQDKQSLASLWKAAWTRWCPAYGLMCCEVGLCFLFMSEMTSSPKMKPMLLLQVGDPWKVLVELMHLKKVPYGHEPLASGVFIWVTKVFMEFVKKSLCVISRLGQQFQVLMNLNLDIGYSAASDKIGQDYLHVRSIQYLSTHSHNRWKRKALGLQRASAWKRYHCSFSVTWPAPQLVSENCSLSNA